MDPTRWSEQEFGDAELGDARLNARLREIAVRVAESSGGSIAAVFRVPAERQAAYHFMSNARIDWEDVVSVSHVDGTGPVGTRTAGARGFQVMNLIVVNRKGVPLGLCGGKDGDPAPKLRRRSRIRLGLPRRMHETVAKASILGGYSLDVKGGHGRTERVAKMIVRSARVTLHMLLSRFRAFGRSKSVRTRLARSRWTGCCSPPVPSRRSRTRS